MTVKTAILFNLFKNSNYRVILKKIFYRFAEGSGAKHLKWYDEQSHSFEDYESRLDQSLFGEAVAYDAQLNKEAVRKLSSLPVKLGGGGYSVLLYYLIRAMKPKVVLETGVAAGFSSQAILQALAINKSGNLYSSDFPYFRVENPEKYIGFLVHEELKSNWQLFIEGDEVNLKKISTLLADSKIDVFHYDSDKTYHGREFGLKQMQEHFHHRTIIVFDDINDNDHFYDLVSNRPNKPAFRIFKYKRKFIGLVCYDSSFLSELIPAL